MKKAKASVPTILHTVTHPSWLGDRGGLRILQKKWTSFLKARLICSQADIGLTFDILQDVFILRSPDLKEPVIYALFTPQLNNVGLSAVCAYTLSTVEAVFSHVHQQRDTCSQLHQLFEFTNPNTVICSRPPFDG
ncbi:semaphorin-4D-like isoform 4-T8 [Thomomys bottae]